MLWVIDQTESIGRKTFPGKFVPINFFIYRQEITYGSILQVFYRVLTEYNADNDGNLPQKWAGLNVKKGEIIQVISKDDNWMQVSLNDAV